MFGMLLGLVLLIVLAYKGQSMMWVAPVAALVVASFGGLDLLAAYTGDYMAGLVGFVKSWFPMFLLGAMFGKIMEVTGSAHSLARKLSKLIGAHRAIIAVVISCGLLVYGGISLFVVVFAIYPIAVSLFREANLPRRLIPGCIACGAFYLLHDCIPRKSPAEQHHPHPVLRYQCHVWSHPGYCGWSDYDGGWYPLAPVPG